jgi:aspartyl/asparaginyl beta-hydroxylase (cupin superfamily)
MLGVWPTLFLFSTLSYVEPAIITFPFNVVASLWLRTPRFWDPLIVEPKLISLLNNFHHIQAETRQIIDTQHLIKFEDVSPHQKRIAASKPWSVFPLFSYGTINEENCKKMPNLIHILNTIPSIKLAMLSVMERGSNIPTHSGFYKGVLRIHLTLWLEHDGLESARYIEVGKQRYSWKEGELVVFDDTYPHKVLNNTMGKRVVLFMDIDRPTGSHTESMILKAMHEIIKQSPGVKQLAALQEKTI